MLKISDIRASLIEIFDQEGIMVAMRNGLMLEYPRKAGHKCSYVAMYVDGQLVNFDVFSNDKQHNYYHEEYVQ
jgi:hypothetical protein